MRGDIEEDDDDEEEGAVIDCTVRQLHTSLHSTSRCRHPLRSSCPPTVYTEREHK
jgi:hypothetical protein